MLHVAPIAFHVRVTFSIDDMFRMPSVSPATGTASVPSSVSSAVGTFLVPSLSFSRLMLMPFSLPSAPRVST